jgi:hypothetical protein
MPLLTTTPVSVGARLYGEGIGTLPVLLGPNRQYRDLPIEALLLHLLPAYVGSARCRVLGANRVV